MGWLVKGTDPFTADPLILSDPFTVKHTVQVWISWQQRGGGTHDAVVIRALLVLIAGPRVGLRPGRIEPRALKRRLKNYALLTKPRRVAQEEVRKNGHPKKQR